MSPAEFQRNEHADLAHAGRGLIVNVGCNHAVLDLEGGSAAQRHVLADGSDQLFQMIAYRHLLFRVRHRRELLQIAVRLQRELGDFAHGLLEFGVAGNEVRLGVDLDERARLGGGGDADQPLGGDPVCLLRGLGQPFRAEPIDRGFHLAIGLRQRRLAIHHASAGLVAEALDHAGRNLSHMLPLKVCAEAALLARA